MVTIAEKTAAESRLVRPLVAVGIVLTGLSLRSAITSLGVVLDQVRGALSMSATLAGVLTALPVVCFAVFGAIAPALARRTGDQLLVLTGVGAIVTGLAGRAFAATTAWFLLGSALALAGIGVANIMMPILIKRWFPDRVGLLTGVYSMSAAAGVAVPAGVTVPLSDASGFGWRGGLGSWAVFAAFALVPWLVLLGRQRRPAAAHPGSPSPAPSLLRSSTACCLTAFFGLQALNIYAMMGWLPAILTSAGINPPVAAAMLSASGLIALPLSLTLPRLAAKSRNQRPHVIGIVLGGVAGYLGLLLAPAAAPWLWVVLLSCLHGGFPLAMTLISLRTREPSITTRLSGFVQSGGYALAAAGPLAIGALNDLTGTWTLPLWLLIATLGAELITGLVAARPRFVDTELGA